MGFLPTFTFPDVLMATCESQGNIGLVRSALLLAGKAIPGEFENTRIARTPCHRQFALADFPALPCSYQVVRIKAAESEGGVPFVLGKVMLGLHIGDTGRFVPLNGNDMVGADVLRCRQAGHTFTHNLHLLCGRNDESNRTILPPFPIVIFQALMPPKGPFAGVCLLCSCPASVR